MLQVGQQHMRIILNTVHQCNMIGPGQPILLAVSALRSERYQALHNMTHKLRLFSGLAQSPTQPLLGSSRNVPLITAAKETRFSLACTLNEQQPVPSLFQAFRQLGAARSIKGQKKKNENEEVGKRRELPFSLHCVQFQKISIPPPRRVIKREKIFSFMLIWGLIMSRTFLANN